MQHSWQQGIPCNQKAKTFIQKFDLIKRDATIDKATNKTASCISKVINEQRRFEGVKNRREPYAIAMHRLLHQQTQLQAKHCKESACCDWFLLALLFGWRQIEFCQSAGSGILTRVCINLFNELYAFTLNDIKLYGTGKIELNFETAIEIPTLMQYIKVPFCWQKNGDHGIDHWCAQNDKSPYLCPVRRWHSWRSDAWKNYVRDLIVTAIIHNIAMLQADTIPQL